MIWSPSCSSSGPASAPGAMVMTAVWLRSVCWSTRKNRPRWASASTTSIARYAVVAAARSARTAAAGSAAPKTAEPATRVEAPSSASDFARSAFTPPSTETSTGLVPRSFLTSRIFRCALEMNDWPPKPGFTDITSTRSRSSSTNSGAELADLSERALEMRASLDVHRDHVGAGGHEFGDVALGLDDHQVDVERQPRALADRRDDDGADRDVRHEPPVHDVDVELVGAARLDARDVGGQGGEVGREDRGRDLDHGVVIPESY